MTLFSTDLTGRLLARYALQGLISLEALDMPTGNWQTLEADRQDANNRALRQGRGPVFSPPAEWRNLAREWIADHPQEWETLLRDTLAREQSSISEPIANTHS